MTAISEDVGLWLQSNGHGTLVPKGSPPVAGEDIFTEHQPDSPDAYVAIFETGGLPPQRIISSPDPWAFNPGCQIIVRGAAGDYDGPRARIEAIRNTMHRLVNTVIGARTYLGALQIGSGINDLDVDQQQRRTLTVNFLIKLVDPT